MYGRPKAGGAGPLTVARELDELHGAHRSRAGVTVAPAHDRLTVDSGNPSRRGPIQLRRLLPRLAAGGLLGMVLVAVAIHQVPLAEIGQALGHARPLPLCVAALAAAGFIVARAWRYRVLTFPAPRAVMAGRPSLAAMVLVTLASWGPGLILPTATSDATFVWLSATRLGVPVERSAAAVVLARLLDFASLLLVGLVTAPLAGVQLPLTAEVGGMLGVGALGALVAVPLWGPSRRKLGRLLLRLPYVSRRARRLEASLAELTRTRSLIEMVVSTGLARLLTAVQYLALFAAVGLPLGFWQAWFALSVRTLLLAIPIQGLAGLGTTQLWWVTALLLLGSPLHAALVSGLSVHLLDLSVSVSLALLGWVLLLTRRRGAPWE